MARLIGRKPVIGIVSGLLFGGLGILLLGLDSASLGVTPLASVLFTVAGGFFLFVAVMAVLAAAASIVRSRSSRR